MIIKTRYNVGDQFEYTVDEQTIPGFPTRHVYLLEVVEVMVDVSRGEFSKNKLGVTYILKAGRHTFIASAKELSKLLKFN